MADISQTTLSNIFSGMKIFEFRLNFRGGLFLGHYLNQWLFVYRRIYASLGLNELKTRVRQEDNQHNSPTTGWQEDEDQHYPSTMSWQEDDGQPKSPTMRRLEDDDQSNNSSTMGD